MNGSRIVKIKQERTLTVFAKVRDDWNESDILEAANTSSAIADLWAVMDEEESWVSDVRDDDVADVREEHILDLEKEWYAASEEHVSER